MVDGKRSVFDLLRLRRVPNILRHQRGFDRYLGALNRIDNVAEA